jgi:4-hydroxy-3-polyprenylbenzoate decarboxylase
MKNPLNPTVVDSAPSQKNVITKGIDVLATLPIIKHTEEDAGRILGGGNTLVGNPESGFHISFNRAHFQGKDWSSLSINLNTHFEHHVLRTADNKGRLPLTINICTSPAIWIAAGGGGMKISVPVGCNELGIAGALQGTPVEIVNAKTVDAYALACAEWVIEGYVDTKETVWESEEAKKLGEIGKAPFFPEYPGYLGKSYKTYKFQATAITHRDDPIFFTPLAHSIDGNNICSFLREASMYDVGNRICLGLVIDTHILDGMKSFGGIVIQVKKRRRRDEGYQKNIILSAFTALAGLRMVVIVDEDVNIYDPEEVLWAIMTRADPASDYVILNDIRGTANFPTEKADDPGRIGLASVIGIDATIPYANKWKFRLGKHPKVDLKRWFTDNEINKGRAMQSPYAKSMAERRI